MAKYTALKIYLLGILLTRCLYENTKTSSSRAGIIVYGTKRAELISALPNRTSSPYRKLINGGS